jgi:hypothetical protein
MEAHFVPRTSGKTIRAVPRPRSLALVIGLLALHALAREADRALGVVLRAEVAPDGLLSEVVRAMGAEWSAPAYRFVGLVAAGLTIAAAFLWLRRRGATTERAATPARDWTLLLPLLLRPALTLVALGSVAVQPAYPYAFTLPVALTQDWGIAQDLLALAALLAATLSAPRFPAPRAVEVFGACLLVYAAFVPEWAWQWDSHPGNEPKTLRQAVALGHWLTFDAEAVSGPMERLETRPLWSSLASGVSTLARESGAMLAAAARGEAGRDAIRATRISRQVVGGKDGGVYSVLAPGPSILLAPALRVDRAINRARGVEGRIAVSALLFAALGAWLVAALFLLVRDATERPGLAAALSFFFALVPPFLFYFHQFYPEMLGALVLAVAFRTIALRPERIRLDAVRFGTLVAVLPWLHQKFLPVWGVVLVTALVVGWRDPQARAHDRSGWKWAARVLAPSAVSLYLTALYNFAITGSVRPDALFLAWGPGGVTSARLGQGVLGLLFDSRYGILPYVPLLVLAAAGLALGGARRFAAVLPAALAYYLTVASADNWSGAVCNLGRYAMPVVPLAVALVGTALARTSQRRGALALAFALASWTALIALELRLDPHAANDSWLLLAKSTFADGRQYVPGLFIRTWADAAPGLAVQLVVWTLLIAAAAFWLKRAAAGGSEGASPLHALAGTAATLLLAALVLERAAPTTRSRPAWPGELQTGEGATVFLSGRVSVRDDEAVVGPGAVELLVRHEATRGSVGLTLGGSGGFAHPAGRPPLALRPSGAFIELPLTGYHEVRGRDRRVVFTRGYVWLEREAVLRPTSMEPGAGEAR